jgi:hypothetical protein
MKSHVVFMEISQMLTGSETIVTVYYSDIIVLI